MVTGSPDWLRTKPAWVGQLRNVVSAYRKPLTLWIRPRVCGARREFAADLAATCRVAQRRAVGESVYRDIERVLLAMDHMVANPLLRHRWEQHKQALYASLTSLPRGDYGTALCRILFGDRRPHAGGPAA